MLTNEIGLFSLGQNSIKSLSIETLTQDYSATTITPVPILFFLQ